MCHPLETPSSSAVGAGLVLLETSENNRRIFDASNSRVRKMYRAVTGTARALQTSMQQARERYRVAFITLTYRPGTQWEPRDISGLLHNYRKWCDRRGVDFRGVWVLEKTKAGVPHYHILMYLPRGITPPLPDRQGWWKKGSTNAKWARRPVGYVAKYASKADSKDILPAGARLHGAFGLRPQEHSARLWCSAPKWLRETIPFTHGVKMVKGWYRDLTTSLEYKSPWVVDKIRGSQVELLWLGWDWSENVRFNDD